MPHGCPSAAHDPVWEVLPLDLALPLLPARRLPAPSDAAPDGAPGPAPDPTPPAPDRAPAHPLAHAVPPLPAWQPVAVLRCAACRIVALEALPPALFAAWDLPEPEPAAPAPAPAPEPGPGPGSGPDAS